MATFEVQVEGLTGLSIDSTTNPTQDEVTQYLKDGVLDVTNRTLQLKPQDMSLFIDETALQVAQGVSIDSARIVSVVRADGVTAGNFRPCRKISLDKQYTVTDPESLEFASKFNPAYLQGSDGTVKVFPAPSDNSGKDSYKVHYVNNIPKNGGGSALLYSHDSLGYFPADKVYLVVIYASIKSLQNALAALNSSLPIVPVMPVLSDSSLSFTTTAPVYNAPSVSPDYADANNWINVEEDEELLAARMQVISGQLNQFKADIQNEVSNFNKLNAEYQAELQRATQDAQLSSQDDAQKLQKYSHEVAAYGTDVEKHKTDYEWILGRLDKLSQQYDTAFILMQPKQQQSK